LQKEIVYIFPSALSELIRQPRAIYAWVLLLCSSFNDFPLDGVLQEPSPWGASWRHSANNLVPSRWLALNSRIASRHACLCILIAFFFFFLQLLISWESRHPLVDTFTARRKVTPKKAKAVNPHEPEKLIDA